MSSHCGPSRRGRRVGAWNAATACPSVDCMSLCRLCRQAQRQAQRGAVTGAGESDGEHNTTPRLRWRVPRQAYATPRGVLARAAASIVRCTLVVLARATASITQRRGLRWSVPRQAYATLRVTLARVAASIMQRRGLRWSVPRQAHATPRATPAKMTASIHAMLWVTLARAAASITQRRVKRMQRRGLRWSVPHQAHATPRVELPNAGNVNISVYNLHKYTIWRALAMLKSVLTGRRAPAID